MWYVYGSIIVGLLYVFSYAKVTAWIEEDSIRGNYIKEEFEDFYLSEPSTWIVIIVGLLYGTLLWPLAIVTNILCIVWRK